MTTPPGGAHPACDLLDLRRFITVAHHVPGRIRLKIDPAVRSHPKAATLIGLAEKGHGALRARLNLLARSLVLEYDPGRIDPDLLMTLFAGTDPHATAGAAHKLAEVLGLSPQA